MTRDEIAQAMQDSAGNSWGNEAHFQRFAALVIAAERERIIAANAPEIERCNAYIKALEDNIRARGQDPMPLFDDWDKDWTK